MVATPVKLEPVTVEFKLVPVKVSAFAMIFVEPADVNLPFSSTVKVGIEVAEPYVPEVTPEFAKVAAAVTFPEPSNVGLVYVTSPVKAIVLPVANFVAVLALPVKAPVKSVELTETNPVTEVTVPPKVIVVDPNVVVLLAN